jgi:hypothetical protein
MEVGEPWTKISNNPINANKRANILDFSLDTLPRPGVSERKPFEYSRPASDQPPGPAPYSQYSFSFLNATYHCKLSLSQQEVRSC